MTTRDFHPSYTKIGDNIRKPRTTQARYDNQFSSGLYTGGLISINSGDNTKIDISAGTGVLIDNYTDPTLPFVKNIQWNDYTAIDIEHIAVNFTSYIAIDIGGFVKQFSGPIDPVNRRDYIILGIVIHTQGTIVESVSNFPSVGYDIFNVFNDLTDSIGIINRNGNIFSANGANLKLDKSTGQAYKLGSNFHTSRKSPNITDNSALTAPDLFKPYRDGSGGFSIDFPLTDSVDPTKYDDGTGTLATVTANDPWTVQRIYYDPANDDVIVHYGQNVYKQLDIAENSINGESFNKNPVLDDAILRSFLIVHRSCTDLSDTDSAKFIAADKFGQVPAQGVNSNIPAGLTLSESVAKTADFTVNMGKSYIIDNSGGAITGTLTSATANKVGQSCECWVTSNTLTNNVTFAAPNVTDIINGVAGSDPDVITGVLNATISNYKRVIIRIIAEGTYLINGLNSVTT